MEKNKNKYFDIDEDYQGLPRITLDFNSLQIPIINALHTVSRGVASVFHSKDIATKKVDIKRDNEATLKAVIFEAKNITEKRPLLIYFHGGGFAITYTKKHIEFCKQYAKQANCSVLLVDYRLSPKNRFPKAFNDGYSSLEWTIKNAGKLNIDQSKIAIAGDSAGGCIAAGVTQKAIDHGINICGQLLIYPALDCRCISESANKYHNVPIWNTESNRRMWKAYLGNIPIWNIPKYASPGLTKNLFGLPKTYIETAEFDPLRDEGILYAKRLSASNITTIKNHTKNTVHGYDSWGKSNVYSKRAFKERTSFLNTIFSN